MINKQQLERFKQYVKEHNMLMGTQIAPYLGYEHAVFHDILYQFAKKRNDTPKIYEYDGNYYVPSVDPFDNPILGMKLYGTATYGIEKKDIPLLLEVFPQNKDQIKSLQDCFE